ncbi:MAG: hypothetical protein KatS3mg068_2313 [Candidatus Sericytochromatia bacterium]|nr:MAG: hypothetical protein KatS3mg068_2313 [Candidatus Sericytochromatia bacterium]
MNTQALIFMLLTQFTVTAFTVYFFYKILSKDKNSEN